MLAAVLLLGASLASEASSTTIFSYDAGSNGVPAVAPDPTSAEGGSWFLTDVTAGSTNLISEPLSPDPLYTNLNAWAIFDDTNSRGSITYVSKATDEQVTNAIWCGWKASAYLRVADPVPGNAGGNTIFFQFGSTNTIWNRRYVVYADINADGALYLNSVGGVIVTVTTNETDALAYHLYEIVYDSATSTAELRVDGQVASSNWPSLSIPASVDGCLWGSGSTGGRGDGYFNQVKVEVNDPSPTTVTLDPVSVTKNVGESATFTADFTGCATGLQWYKDYTPIPGANQRSYTVNFVEPSDAGEYWMGIADPQTGTEVDTAHATLTVNPDSTPPTVVSVTPDLSLQHVRVVFSEGMDPSSAELPSNYQVVGGALAVTNATLLDGTTVDLRMTSEELPGSNYDLIISAVQDQSFNTMLTVTQSFTAPNLVVVSKYDAGTPNNPAMAPDPASTEGGRWYLAGATNDVMTVGDVSPDAPYDFNAWNINDAGSGVAGYRTDYSQSSLDFAQTNGWRLKVRCRLVTDYGSSGPDLGFIFGNPATRRYIMYLKQSGIDLDLKAYLIGGITTNLTTGGFGAGDYHTYEIVFDPSISRASVYFDSNLLSSDWNGYTPAAANDGTYFGAGSGGSEGNMNYNQVEFSVVNATPPVIETSPVSATVAFGGKVTFSGSASGFVAGYQWYKDGAPIAGAGGYVHHHFGQ